MVDPIYIETLALHEAGHLVMRWLLCGEVGSAALDTKALCTPVLAKPRFLEGNPIHRVVINMSGIAAASGYMFAPDWDDRQGNDPFTVFIDDCRRVIAERREQVKRKHATESICLTGIFDCASSVLLGRHEAIQAVTDELLARSKVKTSTFRAICEQRGIKRMTPEQIADEIPSDLLG
jgi:hypothetical protein